MKMTVDRFEGSVAVLEYEGKTYPLPRALLPAGAREGDVVILEARMDEEATRQQRDKITKLMDELFED